MNLPSYLDRMGIPYHLSHHDIAYSAQQLAHAQHISGKHVIKPVLVEADGQMVLCALPASHRVNLNSLQRELGAQRLTVSEERRLRDIFRGCELGAEPPIGAIFGLPTIMDDSLIDAENVTFQAGTHGESVTMTLSDYRRIAQPGVGHFGVQV